MTLTLLLPALALLGGCPQDWLNPAGPSASAPRDEALWLELTQIERIGRARPQDHEARLLVLQSATAPGSPERLEVLTLRGMFGAWRRERGIVEQVRQQLESWPRTATAQQRVTAELDLAYVRGLYFDAQGDVREALKALTVIDEPRFLGASAQPLLRARAALARLQRVSGNVDAALSDAMKAAGIAESLQSPWRQAQVLSELALVYHHAEQPERARLAQADAMTAALRDPDPMLLNQVLTARAILYAEDPDSSITLKAQTEALEQATAAGAEGHRSQALANLADHYLRRGNYARALQLAEEALPLARKTRTLNAEIVARQNMGLAKIATHRVAEGRADARAAITLDEQQGATSYAAASWKELGEYLERAGDYDGAIDAHHEYRRLMDQVMRDGTRKALLEAQERFDAEQRLKEIELLNRENSLKAEQIRARDLQLELWAALAGCIVISATLMGLAYQRIRRTNQALASTNARLKIQSERDPLTGLANRRHFQSVMKDMAREGGLRGTVFLIDIDHFKRINDVQGHAAGDSVLIEVAQRLRQALREDDLVVRWGGEEFLIVVKARESAYAQSLAQRLLDTLAQPPIQHGAQTIAVTGSIGFASFPIEPHQLKLSWERAIDLVDTVMYLAKAHGRNKAYGIEHIGATDQAGLAAIATRMEAACQEGQVRLVALQGPEQRT